MGSGGEADFEEGVAGVEDGGVVGGESAGGGVGGDGADFGPGVGLVEVVAVVDVVGLTGSGVPLDEGEVGGIVLV